MKNSPLQSFIPTIASLIMIGALSLFFVSPFSIQRVTKLPEAQNGGNYCFMHRNEIIHLSIYRDGSMSVGNKSVFDHELSSLFSRTRVESNERPVSVRVYLHPDAPARSARLIYEAGLEAEIHAMYFAVAPTAARA